MKKQNEGGLQTYLSSHLPTSNETFQKEFKKEKKKKCSILYVFFYSDCGLLPLCSLVIDIYHILLCSLLHEVYPNQFSVSYISILQLQLLLLFEDKIYRRRNR